MPLRAILPDRFDQRDRFAARAALAAQADALRVLLPRRQVGDELEAEGAARGQHALRHAVSVCREIALVEQRLQDAVGRHDERERAIGKRQMPDVAANQLHARLQPRALDTRCARAIQHRLGSIDADHGRALPGDRNRDASGAAAQLEDSRAIAGWSR